MSFYGGHGILTVTSAKCDESQDPQPGAEIWLRSPSGGPFDWLGPYYTGWNGVLHFAVTEFGYWDIAGVTCAQLEDNCVKLDVYVGSGSDVDAGKCVMCVCYEPYSAANGDIEPFN